MLESNKKMNILVETIRSRDIFENSLDTKYLKTFGNFLELYDTNKITNLFFELEFKKETDIKFLRRFTKFIYKNNFNECKSFKLIFINFPSNLRLQSDIILNNMKNLQEFECTKKSFNSNYNCEKLCGRLTSLVIDGEIVYKTLNLQNYIYLKKLTLHNINILDIPDIYLLKYLEYLEICYSNVHILPTYELSNNTGTKVHEIFSKNIKKLILSHNQIQFLPDTF
jgi:hypothetical protein